MPRIRRTYVRTNGTLSPDRPAPFPSPGANARRDPFDTYTQETERLRAQAEAEREAFARLVAIVRAELQAEAGAAT